jgi:hypothetical protein
MRGNFAGYIAIVTIVPSALLARSEEIPTLNVQPVCRGIASQSADPGVGQRGQAETFRQCIESERAVRDQLEKAWPTFSVADKRHCVELAKTGGESSNTELLTCLEMSRDVRILRSEAAGRAAPDTTKPRSTPSASSPAAPPAAAAAVSQAVAVKEPAKAPEAASTAELERAKAEAEKAKASEASAQHKLADAEAALQRAKEEIGRATAQAEQAKASERVAKQSEAVAKRQLADAEAARATAEKACVTPARPGLIGRLRGWLKRPGPQRP